MPSDGSAQALDFNKDGKVDINDVSHLFSEAEKGRLDRELDSIRERRLGDTRFFRWAVEDYVLLFGVVFGGFFLLLIATASTGILAEDSVVIDQTLSKTPLDNGGECIDKQGRIWLSVYPDHQDLKIRSYNVPDIDTGLAIFFTDINGKNVEHLIRGFGDLSSTIDGEEMYRGEQRILVSIRNITSHIDSNDSHVLEYSPEIYSQEFEIDVDQKQKMGFFSDGDVIEIDIKESGPRACMTFRDLGEWGWILMAAEWAGGRETAMLTGGSGGVPAWWMAFVSLGMSIVFLYIQYPLMHKMYHREAEEALNERQVRRLIVRVLENSQNEASIKIDFDLLRMQERSISIDVFVPYVTDSRSIMTKTDVRSILMRDLLSEFSIFGEMRPLQLRVQSVSQARVEESIVLTSKFGMQGFNPENVDGDYRPFFESISLIGTICLLYTSPSPRDPT